jgi:hypothetical protein
MTSCDASPDLFSSPESEAENVTYMKPALMRADVVQCNLLLYLDNDPIPTWNTVSPGGSGHHSRRYYGRCGRCFLWPGTGEGGLSGISACETDLAA